MRLRHFAGIIIVLSALAHQAGAQSRVSPVIRVYKNETDRIYTVFFADTVSRNVEISLTDRRGKVLIRESFQTRGVSKSFSLKELKNDEYVFHIAYDGNEQTETIFLSDKPQTPPPAVTLDADFPTLTIFTTSQ